MRPTDPCLCRHPRELHDSVLLGCNAAGCRCKAFVLAWERSYPDGRNVEIDLLRAELADAEDKIRALEGLLGETERKGHGRF